MRIVVLGAGGGVGRHAVDVALEQGHDVVAGARGHTGAVEYVGSEDTGVPENPGTSEDTQRTRGRLEQRVVDVRDGAQVDDALAGADAVLWCVGVTSRSSPDVGRTGMPHVVAAAQRHGVRRLVSVSGAGVTLPDDRKGLGARLVSGLMRRLAHDLVADKEGEHAVLAACDLDWTEVRPPRLKDGGGTGRWTLDLSAPGITAAPVAKRDVARTMVALAGEGGWRCAAPFLHADEG